MTNHECHVIFVSLEFNLIKFELNLGIIINLKNLNSI
jgi:hypothetical protein